MTNNSINVKFFRMILLLVCQITNSKTRFSGTVAKPQGFLAVSFCQRIQIFKD